VWVQRHGLRAQRIFPVAAWHMAKEVALKAEGKIRCGGSVRRSIECCRSSALHTAGKRPSAQPERLA